MARKRGLTEEAPTASIDTAPIDQTYPMLRLPFIRQQFADLAEGAAPATRCRTASSSPSCCRQSATTGLAAVPSPPR